MLNARRWIVPDPHPSVKDLADCLRSSQVLAQVLLNRGLSDPETCRSFLRPDLKGLHDPSLLPNLPQAAQRVAQAIRDGEKIVIYGDYDVDGITAVSILWHAIRLLGGQVQYYIPHRIEEGYGLNSEAIAQLCGSGAKLIISVDCGVTAVECAAVAAERGVELIITDHHEMHDSLPVCHSIVHPRLPGHAPYPNPFICGAGVAFKLAWGVGLAMSGGNRVTDSMRNFLLEAMALAALGTIADVVPLVGENRILAHYGLNSLKHSKLSGLRALIKSAKLGGQNIDCYHAGFVLAPRLNAAGRMGHANLAAQLLTDADPVKADEIATYLDQQNRARQSIEKKILAEAIEQVEQNHFADQRAIVLGAEGWHSGVIGIVASRIVERFHRPTIMIALNNGHGQGSGRSIGGFHLSQALGVCAAHLDAFGGHEMAAGLKIRSENLQAFREAFVEHANSTLDPARLIPELQIDCLAGLEHMSAALVHDLKRLGPFGHGNRKPILCCRGLTLAGPPRRVGKTGDHLQLFVKQGGSHMKCIAFGYGEIFDKLHEGMQLDLAVEPQINEYNGRVSVELTVKDVQLG